MTASLSLRPAAPFADLSTGHVSRLEMDEGIKVPGTIGKNVDEPEFSYPTDVEKTCICIYIYEYIYKGNMDMNISWRHESMFEIRNSTMGILFWMDVQVLIYIVS